MRMGPLLPPDPVNFLALTCALLARLNRRSPSASPSTVFPPVIMS